MAVAPRIVLLDAPEADGGVVVAYVDEIESGTITFRLDRTGRLVFRTKRNASWLSSAQPKQSVFRVDLIEHGLVSEWFYVGDKMEQGSAWIEVVGEPLEYVLRDVGPMRTYTTGGGGNYVQGLADGTIENYLDEFLHPYLLANGITWMQTGTIEDTSRHPISWERWSPMRLLVELETRTGKEFQFRRTGHIDFLTRIGSTAAVPTISAGKNLVSLQRTRAPDGFATVVQAFGAVPEGGVNRSTSGLTLMRCDGVAGNVVTIEPHGGGQNLIAITSQYVGNYLLKPDGTLTLISASSAANQTLTVASASGISTGNLLEIRADSAGSLLEEAVDPDGTARVVGTYVSDDYRGEANYSSNPFVEDWDTKPTAIYARIDGDHALNDSTLSLKEIVPTTHAFKAGDMVFVIIQADSANYRVTADATASGGNVTLSISPSVALNGIPPLLNNCTVVVYSGLTDGLPAGWTDVQSGTSLASVFQHRKTDAEDLSGVISALHDYTMMFSAATVTVSLRLTIGGLTPGDVVYPGDALWFVDTGNTPFRFILVGGTVDGAGEVTVVLATARPSAAVGDSVFIVRPDLPDDPLRTPSTEAVTLVTRRKNHVGTDTGVGGAVIDLDPVLVPYLPDAPNVWFKAGLTVRGFAVLDPTGSLNPPRLQIWVDGSMVQEVVAPAEEMVPDTPLFAGPYDNPRTYDKQVELSCGITLTENTTVTCRLIGCYRTSTEFVAPGPFTVVRWVMLQVGSDDQAAPPIFGSHATKLRQIENEILLLHRQLPEEIQVTSKELVRDFGLTPAEAKLTFGGDVRLMDPDTATDDTYRVAEATYSLTDPSDTSFILTTKHKEATSQIERRLRRLEEGAAKTAAIANASSGSTTPLPVVTSPPTGGSTTPGVGGRDIFVAALANMPTAPTGLTPYWQVSDRGVVQQWTGAWGNIVERSLADKRTAETDGALMATVLSEYESLRLGNTTDASGDPSPARYSGTSFPTSPSASDPPFYRTDRGIEYYYDGTRWLSVQLFHLQLFSFVAANATVSGTVARMSHPWTDTYDIWVEKAWFNHLLSGSGNWTLSLQKVNTAGTGTEIASSGAFSTTNRTQVEVTVNAIVPISDNIIDFLIAATENSGTATLSFGFGSFTYRLIG